MRYFRQVGHTIRHECRPCPNSRGSALYEEEGGVTLNVNTLDVKMLLANRLLAYGERLAERRFSPRSLLDCTRVGTLIVATIYLQLIQNRYMFRSFTVFQCSHQHCVQPVASDVEVVGYL